MEYVYLILSVFLVASTNIIGAFYNKKNNKKQDVSALYNLLLLLAVFVCWLILFLVNKEYELLVLPYSVGFALCYTMCNVGIINALKTGPIMLTSLFCQLSLILVSVYGFFFWNEPFSWLIGLGMVLTIVSIFLCLYNGKNKTENKVNARWILYILMALLGNAGCSIIQRSQQIAYQGKYASFLMVSATFFSLIFCLIIYLRSKKIDTKDVLKTSWYYPVLAGVLNAVLNLFVILMVSSSLSASLIYPVLAVGSLIIITLFSLSVFREKLRWWQWMGVLLGVCATALLSI